MNKSKEIIDLLEAKRRKLVVRVTLNVNDLDFIKTVAHADKDKVTGIWDDPEFIKEILMEFGDDPLRDSWGNPIGKWDLASSFDPNKLKWVVWDEGAVSYHDEDLKTAITKYFKDQHPDVKPDIKIKKATKPNTKKFLDAERIFMPSEDD
jgi:hypothetical protein